jgi:RNA polymerase sigma-70 factor, ECF subfamily
MVGGGLTGPVDAAAELATLLSDDLRNELYRHCYQMLGSVEDAEDALQEVLVRLWRGLDGFERRSSFRTWAHRIAINVCLSALRSRARRPPSVGAGAEHEETSAGPGRDASSRADVTLSGSPHERYERHESVELAVVAVLHHLPPNQRAALMMRDVLGFTAQESAAALGTSTAAVNSALQHARATVGRLDPEISTASVPVAPDTVRLVGQYVAALEEADLAAVLRLVGEDTSWAMPPLHVVYRGREEIARFLQEGPLTYEWRHVLVDVGARPSVACFARRGGAGPYEAQAVDVLEIGQDRIRRVTSFLDPQLFASLGLPRRLSAEHPAFSA